MKILILTEKDANCLSNIPTTRAIFESDMVIKKGKYTFDIVKSRYGDNYENLPYSLLSKILDNPQGRMVYDWV